MAKGLVNCHPFPLYNHTNKERKKSMSVYERLYYLALGGTKKYQHKLGRENKNATKLQNFLDQVNKNRENRQEEN